MRRALLAFLLLAAAAAPDEVVLVSGGRLSGEILEETATHIKLRLPHGTLVVPKTKVREVVREKRRDYLQREARASLKTGSTATAVELYERALKEAPGDAGVERQLVAALLEHARFLRTEHRLQRAEGALQRLAELDPGHTEAASLGQELRQEAQEGAELRAQARAALGRGDHREALRLLDAWRLRRPVGDPVARGQMAQAHIEAGTRAQEDGRLRASLNHFRAAASFGARNRVDEALRALRPVAVLESLEEGQTEQARRLIDTMTTTYPDPAVPLFLEAVRHHVLGQVQEAVNGYAEAARVAERNVDSKKKCLDYDLVRQYASATLRAAIARPPQEGLTRWRELFLGPLRRDESSTHFVVYAPTQKLAKETGQAADRIYERIARDLLGGLPGATKAEIVVHATRQSYLAADPVPPQSPWAKVLVSRTKTGGICYDTLDENRRPVVRVETYAAARLLEDTMPHEIVHVVQRRGLDVFRRGHWLDEGLATLFESDRSILVRIGNIRRNGRIIPLPEFLSLKSTPPERLELFYDQACALASYLRKLGSAEDWRSFLRSYAGGSFAAAIRDVYRIDSIDALERQFRA